MKQKAKSLKLAPTFWIHFKTIFLTRFLFSFSFFTRLNMALSVHPFGFHLVNLLLHIVVTFLVARLLLKVLQLPRRLALLGAALFATHPIHCEAVRHYCFVK